MLFANNEGMIAIAYLSLCRRLKPYLLGLLLCVLGCSVAPPEPTALRTESTELSSISYLEDIEPIFNRRCVVCHSCNDAPCQLNQAAYEGLVRGASKSNVYADRLFTTAPTRLFIDAKSTKEWREKGFFPVIHHYPAGDERNLNESVLYQLLELRKSKPLPAVRFDADTSRNCINPRDPVDTLKSGVSNLWNQASLSAIGMPFGFPALSEAEFTTIRAWLVAGAPGPDRNSDSLSRDEQSQILNWEKFLNADEPKQRLVSRYLYEHLYLAHLYFEKRPNKKLRPTFFRLVRSRTESPQVIDEIGTRLPYDSPGSGSFYYRLKPLETTVVSKTHLPYRLSPERLENFRERFLSPEWTLTEAEIPSYVPTVAANPFVTFMKIPARARYQFMLEDSEYFVGTFMKSPVCRGQLALNVINDHFHIFFLDPDSDESVSNPRFLEETAESLVTPFRPDDLFSLAAGANLWQVLELPVRAIDQLQQSFYPYFKTRQLSYLEKRDQWYAQRFPKGFALNDIWDGDSKNTNAVLTVFRHFDSASVTNGAVGGIPKTSLILDYPIFERMYYNLVVSFDIYGDIKHQLSTRLYMDDLRIEGEDLFLSFLPLNTRVATRDYWYRGAEPWMNGRFFPFYGTSVGKPRETQIPFDSSTPVVEALITKILREHLNSTTRGTPDLINYAAPSPAVQKRFRSLSDVRKGFAEIAAKPAPYVIPWPDHALIRIRLENKTGPKHFVLSVVHNRGHFNVKDLFGENTRLDPSLDTLSFIEGYEGSYPNFFFDISLSQTEEFISAIKEIRPGDDSFEQFAKRFGVTRRNENFWEISDWFMEDIQRQEPIEGGILDLNRYANY